MTDRQEIRAKSVELAIGLIGIIRPKRIFTVDPDGKPSKDDLADKKQVTEFIFETSALFEDFILKAPGPMHDSTAG
jgi:hypothetical protein